MAIKRILIKSAGLIIQPVGEEALQALLDVYHLSEDFLALGPEPEASEAMVLADLRQSLQAGGIYCGIYRSEGQMIGVVDFIAERYQGDPAAAYLELLMLARPYRSLGLGSVVASLIENEICKNTRVDRIHSHVQVNNPKALAFWQRMGYRITGEALDRPDGTTVLPMMKVLCQ